MQRVCAHAGGAYLQVILNTFASSAAIDAGEKVVGVPPIVSILALIIGAKLAGFIGLVVSVPIAAAAMEYFNDLEKDKAILAGRAQ